jgi:hypothetical protein
LCDHIDTAALNVVFRTEIHEVQGRDADHRYDCGHRQSHGSAPVSAKGGHKPIFQF